MVTSSGLFPLYPCTSQLLYLGCLYLVLQLSKQTPAVQEFVILWTPLVPTSAWGSRFQLSIALQLLWFSSAALYSLYLCSFSPSWRHSFQSLVNNFFPLVISAALFHLSASTTSFLRCGVCESTLLKDMSTISFYRAAGCCCPDDFWAVPPTTPESLPMGVSAWSEFSPMQTWFVFLLKSPEIFLSWSPSATFVPTTGLCGVSQICVVLVHLTMKSRLSWSWTCTDFHGLGHKIARIQWQIPGNTQPSLPSGKVVICCGSSSQGDVPNFTPIRNLKAAHT